MRHFPFQSQKKFWETPVERGKTPSHTRRQQDIICILARQFKEQIVMARHLPKVGQPCLSLPVITRVCYSSAFRLQLGYGYEAYPLNSIGLQRN